LEFDVEKIRRKVNAATHEPVKQAAILVDVEARRLLNIGGGTNHAPSAPGEPPHKQWGTLQASIRYAKVASNWYVIGPTTVAWYGRVHEFGGKNHPPRPFMRRALENLKAKFAELFKDCMGK